MMLYLGEDQRDPQEGGRKANAQGKAPKAGAEARGRRRR
jgi:hypothetical protein